jgi:hydrogenase/urease accessory protein HupE
VEGDVMSARRWFISGGALLACGKGTPAYAHLVSTELGPFYDGAAHPLVTPEDLLTIAAFAILASFRGTDAGRRTLFALCGGWTTGLVAAFGLACALPASPLAMPVALLAAGALGIAGARLHGLVLAVSAVLTGFARGVANGGAARTEAGEWLTILGIGVSVFAIDALCTALAARLAQLERDIVLRVAASWIAAIALLMLGWELR